MASYNEYMKGMNQNTADQSPPEKEQTSNFNKVRQFMDNSPIRNNMTSSVPVNHEKHEKSELVMDDSRRFEPSSLLTNSTSPGRRSSVDLSDLFFKSGNRQPKKKLSVDDFFKIKELGSGKYGRVYLVR